MLTDMAAVCALLRRSFGAALCWQGRHRLRLPQHIALRILQEPRIDLQGSNQGSPISTS